MPSVVVRAVPIELTPFLKFAGAGDTGGGVKATIQAGQVKVNGKVETRRARKLTVGDVVRVDDTDYTVTLK